MKLVIPKSFMGSVYVDDGSLGLGPGDIVLIGPHHIAALVDGRIGVIEKPARRSR